MTLAEVAEVEHEILEALLSLQENRGNSEAWTCREIEDRLPRASFPNLNGHLMNLERKGYTRHEKRPVPGYKKRRMYHWQITIAGCAALMRLRQKGQ